MAERIILNEIAKRKQLQFFLKQCGPLWAHAFKKFK